MRILIALAAAGLVSASECDGADAFKVSDAVVVKARFEDKGEAEHLALAAAELTNAMFRTTGRLAPVFEEGAEPPDAKAAIYIGPASAASAAGITGEGMRNGDWRVKCADGRAFLFGKTAFAATRAVFEFMERTCDYHVLTVAGDDVFTFNPDLAAPVCDRTTRPAIYGRSVYHAMYDGRKYPTTMKYWTRYGRALGLEIPRTIEGRYRVSPQVRNCHSSFGYLPPEKWFAKHPEYYSMGPDGKRHGVENAQSQLCYTNPDTYRLVLESLERFVAADRAACPNDPPLVYDFTQGDNSDFLCLCPGCRKVIAKYNRVEGGHKEGGDAGLQLEFVNRLARDIRRKYPDVQVRTFAYVSTERAPKPGTIAVEPNVRIWWCDVYSHSDHTIPLRTRGHFNELQVRELEEWLQLTGNIEVWDYMLSGGAMPEVSADAIKADAAFFAESKIPVLFMESEFRGQPLYELNYYLMSKLYVDPSLDLDELIRTYCRSYGAAAEIMYKSIQRLRRRIVALHARTASDWHSRVLPWLEDPSTMKEFATGLQTAYDALPPESAKARVTSALAASWKQLVMVYKKDPSAAAAYADAQEKYRKFAKEAARTALMEPSARANAEASVDEMLELLTLKFKDLPDELRSVSDSDLVCADYHAACKSQWFDDPASERGRAVFAKDYKKMPVPCGVYDMQSKDSFSFEIKAEDMRPGVYSWVKLGRCHVGRDSLFWFPGSWRSSFGLKDHHILADGMDTDPNWYELWASAREGDGMFLIDRLVFRRVKAIAPAAPDLSANARSASPEKGARNECVLPGESCTNAPVANSVFPDRMSEYVWRNWFCVDKRTLAATVGAKPEELTEIATQMGLPPDPVVEPEWQKHGYVTVLRRNWHILPYEQLMELVGWDRATFRYHLDEDDYLYAKMGALKPKCDKLTWRGKEEERFADARRRIAAILKEEGVDAFSAGGEPRFAFMRELAAPPTTCKTDVRAESPFKTRLQFSYFADYADPLMDDSVASFPEGLLARYAKDGVNAVWLHVVLRTLAKDRHFTEFGEGCDRRQENLRKLVARAAKYGIKVFLYMNEPRPMPCAFFDSPKNAPCRGTLEWRGVTNAMCIETPEVRRWMKDAMEQVFRAAPGLGGIFIIGASENLVHCQAHGPKSVYENDKSGWCKPDQFCKRCENLSFAQLVAEDASLLIEGMHRADPSAKAFVWDWGWGTYARGGDVAVVGEVLPRLPKDNVSFMTMSERMLPLSIDGVNCFVNEYSLSQVGPSEAAKEKWAMARKAGLGCIAKAQVSSSWEMAIVPYVPVMDNIARHAFNLAHNGVDGVMLSWSCGCYPSPNLMVFNGVRADDGSYVDVLARVSRELYGDRAAPFVRRVWTTLSKAFSRYPFNSATLYRAPHHMGPANPLYFNKTGYAATMVGMPYDDLDGWRSIFPAETYIARCRQVAEGFDEGARQWQEVVAVCEGESKALAEREHGIIRTVGLHMASCADQSLFVLARDRGDKEEMREIAQRELVRAKALLSIAERDSRIGYECSCHYFYTPQDLREKVLNCRMILSVAADAAGTTTCR